MDLPAIKKEDIKISLNEGYLKISATFHDENEKNEQHGKYIHKERHYGSYSRSFYLGENVNEKDIHAKLENGVLTLNIEKREEKEKACGKTRQLTGKNNTIPYSSNKECGMISMLKLFGN